MTQHMDDDQIRDGLEEIDVGDFDVTGWEADFLQSILHEWEGPLTERQRESAEKMIEKYT